MAACGRALDFGEDTGVVIPYYSDQSTQSHGPLGVVWIIECMDGSGALLARQGIEDIVDDEDVTTLRTRCKMWAQIAPTFTFPSSCYGSCFDSYLSSYGFEPASEDPANLHPTYGAHQEQARRG